MEELQLLLKNAENPVMALGILLAGKIVRDFFNQLIKELKDLNVKMAVIVERVEGHEKRLDRIESKNPPG